MSGAPLPAMRGGPVFAPAPEPLHPGATATLSSQLQLLLESTGEGIFGVDMAGHCTFINRAGAQMLGWTAAQVLGQNMHVLIHHTHADGRHYPESECPIFNAFRQGLPCRIDSEVLWRADGSAFAAEYSSHPILDAGQVQGAVVTLVDITERKRGEALLRQARDELEQRVAERTAELSGALGQLRELSAYLETVREDERTRIAREIHDELGSLLVALRLDVNWVETRLAGQAPLFAGSSTEKFLTGKASTENASTERASIGKSLIEKSLIENSLIEKCHGMGTLIDTAVENLGRIITDLRPSILDHQGLWAALEWQAQEFIDSAELPRDVRMYVEAGVEAPAGVHGERWAIAVFRIFQEMLSNVARHAQARALRIRLYVDAPPGPVLHLEVCDDGIGAAPASLDHPRSYGVMGMRERAGHFGGRLAITSAPGRGTCVRLTMPLPGGVPP